MPAKNLENFDFSTRIIRGRRVGLKFYTKINDSGKTIDYFEHIYINNKLKELINFMRNLIDPDDFNIYMCIAGGYIYDSLSSQKFVDPKNDIDIFTNFTPNVLNMKFKKLGLSSDFYPAVFAKNYFNNSEDCQELKGFKCKKLSIHCMATKDIHNTFDISLCQAGIYIENPDLEIVKFKASKHFVEDFPNKITINRKYITVGTSYAYTRFEKYVKKIGTYPTEVNVIPTDHGIKIPILRKINNSQDYMNALLEAETVSKLITDSQCGTILDDPNPKII